MRAIAAALLFHGFLFAVMANTEADVVRPAEPEFKVVLKSEINGIGPITIGSTARRFTLRLGYQESFDEMLQLRLLSVRKGAVEIDVAGQLLTIGLGDLIKGGGVLSEVDEVEGSAGFSHSYSFRSTRQIEGWEIYDDWFGR